MIYGVAYHDIDETFDLGSDEALNQGPAVAMIELMAETSTVILDEGQSVPDELVELTESSFGQDGICTLAGLVHTEDTELREVAEQMVPAAADAWIRSNNTDNNLWAGTTGNSIRDLIEATHITRDTSFFDVVRTPMTSILADFRVQEATKQVLFDAAQAGDLEHLPTQVLYLANVDTTGVPLASSSSTGVSALQAGARLISNSNTELTCEVFGFEIEFDNMATAILQELAERDSDDVTEGLELLSSVLGSRITQTIIEEIADSGICPAVDRQLLADLEVINRLQDPAVGNLVVVVHGMLDAVYDQGNYNRLPEVVDLISAVHEENLAKPIDEVLRDVASTSLSKDIGTWIATLNDPSMLQVDACPDGSTPYDFDQVWNMAQDLAAGDHSTTALRPVAIHLLESDKFWTFIDRASALAVQDEASIHSLPKVVVEIFADQNVQEVQSTLLPPINEPTFWKPLLRVAESPEVRDALIQPSSKIEGPLPFIARLITSDTVTVMLQTIEVILDSLGSGDDSSSS